MNSSIEKEQATSPAADAQGSTLKSLAAVAKPNTEIPINGSAEAESSNRADATEIPINKIQQT